MYRKIFALHSWLGLLSGVLLLLVALSGVLLLFMDELDPVFYKAHFYTKDRGVRLPYDSLYTRIVKAHPDAQNIYFRGLDEVKPDQNVLFSYGINKDGDEDYIGGAINPYTGEIVSRRSEREKLSENFFGWMLRFHFQLYSCFCNFNVACFRRDIILNRTPPRFYFVNEIEHKIIYSILNKKPKRANIHWFIHIDTVDTPYTEEYSVDHIIPNDNIRVKFRLGFRVQPRINLLFRKVVEDLVANKELNVTSRYESLEKKCGWEFSIYSPRKIFKS